MNESTYTIATPVHSNDATMQNMEFIAHARDGYPAALREIQVLRRALVLFAKCLNGTEQSYQWAIEKARKELGSSDLPTE